jgi:hypothetical protein
MFVRSEDDFEGLFLIPQTSHSWLAWQLAMHWGNRRFPRPAPRAEVLAAVLLHDIGWSDFDASPGIEPEGKPRAFNRMVATEHLAIWRASVSRAALHSRYAALLVAHHFAVMAERKTTDSLARGDTPGARSAQAFRAEMERLQASWREALEVDSRYQGVLDGSGWEANATLLAAVDRISVHLCANLPSPFTVEAHNASGEPEAIELALGEERTWRVHPWPLEGDRVRLHCEGRRVLSTRFSTADELHQVMVRAPVERISFTLLRPSAKG